MKAPRYSDNRYPHGYVRSEQTDVRKTFARIKRQMAEQQKELDAKVAPIKARKANG